MRKGRRRQYSDRLSATTTTEFSLIHATSPSQNVSCFNLVQTPPWWIACSINLDCFFKLFPSSPPPCVNKLSNPLISAGTRYHLTSLYPLFFMLSSSRHIIYEYSCRAKFSFRPLENSLTSWQYRMNVYYITYPKSDQHGHRVSCACNTFNIYIYNTRLTISSRLYYYYEISKKPTYISAWWDQFFLNIVLKKIISSKSLKIRRYLYILHILIYYYIIHISTGE